MSNNIENHKARIMEYYSNLNVDVKFDTLSEFNKVLTTIYNADFINKLLDVVTVNKPLLKINNFIKNNVKIYINWLLENGILGDLELNNKLAPIWLDTAIDYKQNNNEIVGIIYEPLLNCLLDYYIDYKRHNYLLYYNGKYVAEYYLFEYLNKHFKTNYKYPKFINMINNPNGILILENILNDEDDTVKEIALTDSVTLKLGKVIVDEVNGDDENDLLVKFKLIEGDLVVGPEDEDKATGLLAKRVDGNVVLFEENSFMCVENSELIESYLKELKKM